MLFHLGNCNITWKSFIVNGCRLILVGPWNGLNRMIIIKPTLSAWTVLQKTTTETWVCLWQKGWNQQQLYVCRWILYHWTKTTERKWEAEWLKHSADSQWISQGVVTLHSRKGKTLPGQTCKVMIWLRERTSYQRWQKSWRETAEDQSHTDKETGVISQHSSALAGSVRKGMQKQSLFSSLWFRSVFSADTSSIRPCSDFHSAWKKCSSSLVANQVQKHSMWITVLCEWCIYLWIGMTNNKILSMW